MTAKLKLGAAERAYYAAKMADFLTVRHRSYVSSVDMYDALKEAGL